MCEFFLKTHGLRQAAEVALYRLLISVKNTYRRNSHVKLFARFLNLLQPSEAQHHSSSEDANTGSHDDPAVDAAQAPSKRKRSGYLNLSFLRVFLTARFYLLRAPPPTLAKARGGVGHHTSAAGTKLRAGETPHIIQLEPTTKWVPLDHAVSALRWYISYLPDEGVVRYCREVEHSTAIYAGGALTEVSGNRLAVRAEMRRAMLASESATAGGGGGDTKSHPEEDEKELKRRPRIVADVHKVLLLLLDALEQRQEVMARDLVALFDAVRQPLSSLRCVLRCADAKYAPALST